MGLGGESRAVGARQERARAEGASRNQTSPPHLSLVLEHQLRVGHVHPLALERVLPLDPRVGVEHVGRRVSVKREHLRVGEAVVRLTVEREVGVLHSTDADGAGDQLSLLVEGLTISLEPALNVFASDADLDGGPAVDLYERGCGMGVAK